MSIVTVINQDSGQAASIDSEKFTETVAPWFSRAGEGGVSDTEEFILLAEIIEDKERWADEEGGELARSLGLTIEFGAVDAELHLDSDHGVDTIVVIAPESGDEITRIQIDASEDQEPYDDALRAAGFTEFTWQ